MTNIVILDNRVHRDLTVSPAPSAGFGDARNFVPVVVDEFPDLVLHYPILFSKDAQTGALYCGAMLGIDAGENLFLDRPADVYRPLNLRRDPFYMAGEMLAIDLDSPRVNAAGGKALFTASGTATPYLESITAIMRELHPGLERTRHFVETLIRLKLIEPIDMDIGFDDGSKRMLQGLYTVDRAALRALPDTQAVELFRRGYLQLCYLMTASLKQVPALARRKNGRLLEGNEMLSPGFA